MNVELIDSNRKFSDKDGGKDMPTLSEIFDKRKILLYQNESLDLDHYYQDEIKEMGKSFETNHRWQRIFI